MLLSGEAILQAVCPPEDALGPIKSEIKDGFVENDRYPRNPVVQKQRHRVASVKTCIINALDSLSRPNRRVPQQWMWRRSNDMTPDARSF